MRINDQRNLVLSCLAMALVLLSVAMFKFEGVKIENNKLEQHIASLENYIEENHLPAPARRP